MSTAALALCLLLAVSMSFAAANYVARRWRAWDWSATLVLAAGVGASTAPLSGHLLGGTKVVYGLYDQRIVSEASWVATADKAGLALISLSAAAYLAKRSHRFGAIRPTPTGILVLGIVLAGSAGSWLAGGPLLSQRWVVTALLALCILVGGRTQGAILGAITFGTLIAIVSLLLAGTGSDLGSRICRADKCGPLGTLITGVYGNENALALTMALTLPFLLLAGQAWYIDLLFVTLTLSVWLTGSRSALIGVAVATGFWIARHARRSRTVRSVATLLVATGIVAQLILPQISDPASFTGRPQLWQLAFGLRGESRIFGAGWDALERLFQSGGSIQGTSSYSLHNQLLDIYYTGGLVACGLFFLLVITLYRRLQIYGAAALAVLAVPLWIGILERPWSFAQVDWLSWSLLATCLASTVREGADDRAADKHRSGAGVRPHH